jgi:hypothetical protein
VGAAVAGKKGDPSPGDLAEGDGSRRGAERRIDRELVDVVEQ